MAKRTYITEMLQAEDEQLRQLHAIVEKSIEDERALSTILADGAKDDTRTIGERIADKVADFGGSWKFIILFTCILLAWVTINTHLVMSKPFDPYPFILLNLFLSCLAAMQAPIMMMSQKRQEARDRKRSENDYMINLKAELEIRRLHEKLDVSTEAQYKHLCELQQKQIELLEEILRKERGKAQ